MTTGTKTKLKYIAIFILVLSLVGVGFYLYWLSRGAISESTPRVYDIDRVVQISRQNISDQDVIKYFGVTKILSVNDNFFRLKITKTDYSKLESLSIPFSDLPYDHSIASDGQGIWIVEIVEPVYNSKVQALANFGTIVSPFEKNSFLIWTNRSRLDEIRNLGVVKSLTPYYSYQRISEAVAEDLHSVDRASAQMKILTNNANLASLKSSIESRGVKVGNESQTTFLAAFLELVVFNIEFSSDQVSQLLSQYPQIVSLDSIPQ